MDIVSHWKVMNTPFDHMELQDWLHMFHERDYTVGERGDWVARANSYRSETTSYHKITFPADNEASLLAPSHHTVRASLINPTAACTLFLTEHLKHIPIAQTAAQEAKRMYAVQECRTPPQIIRRR